MLPVKFAPSKETSPPGEIRAAEGDLTAGELRPAEVATVERNIREVKVTTTPCGRSARPHQRLGRLSYRRAAELFTTTGWTLHQLRHTLASESSKTNTAHSPVLQKITGHTSLRTLTDTRVGKAATRWCPGWALVWLTIFLRSGRTARRPMR